MKILRPNSGYMTTSFSIRNLLSFLILSLICLTDLQAQFLNKTFKNPVPVRAAKITSLKVLADGSTLVGGEIAFYENNSVSNLIKLNPDGSLNETFSFIDTKDLIIKKIETLSNGDIIVLARGYKAELNMYLGNHSLFYLDEQGSIKKELHDLPEVSSITVYDDSKFFIYGLDNFGGFLHSMNIDFTIDSTFASFDNLVTDVEVYNGKFYVSGLFSEVNGAENHDVVKLNSDGTVDNTFSTGSGTNDYIGSITIQENGKVLLGSTFLNSFNDTYLNGMARLNTDGSVDSNFTPPSLNGPVSEIFLNGTSIFASAFVSDSDTTKDIFFKLEENGLYDESFPAIDIDEFAFSSLSIGFDGESIMVNNSSTYGNIWGLSKYDPTGALIESFKPEIGRYGTISCGDFFKGKLVVGGDFLKINGLESYGLARLNVFGEVDESFLFKGIKQAVLQIKVLNNSSVLVSTGKEFFKLNEAAEIQPDFNFSPFKTLYGVLKFKVLNNEKIVVSDPNNPYKLNSDGSEDTSFDIGTGISPVSTAFDFDVQSDHKVIFGSILSEFDGTPVNKLVRINADGSLDPSFNIGEGSNEIITFIKVLKNDEVIIGGFFNKFDGVDVPHGIVKLSKDGALDHNFLDNQRASPYFNWGFMDVKAEQLGNKIFFKDLTSISVLNVDGTVNRDFNFPLNINKLTHIIALADTSVQSTEGGRIKETNDQMFAFGSFQGQEDVSPSFLVKVDLLTSTDEENEEIISGVELEEIGVDPLSIYPNPVESFILVKSNTSIGASELVVYDITGKVVCRSVNKTIEKNEPLRIDAEKLKPGVYLLSFFSENGLKWTKRFIKK